MNPVEKIQEGLIDLLLLLQGISTGQLRGLSQFVSPKSNQNSDFNIGLLFSLLRESSAEELERQTQIASRSYEFNEKSPPDEKTLQFSRLFRLFLFQKTLKELTMTQLLKFYDLIPTQKQQILQLQALQDIQQLLSQLDSETLVSLHQELTEISKQNPGTEAEQLHKMVQLNTEHFYLYEPLRFLLQLPIEELLNLQTFFPQFEAIQLHQLTDLFALENGIYLALDYITLLVPRKVETDPILKQVQFGTVQPEPYVNSLYLEILEQPPQKCVYKRNVKPPPRLLVEGDQNQNDGNLFVVPLLLRCDTFEEEPKLLNGNEPLRITSGRTMEFKRLKILSTSHQLNESLFALKFELRRYKGNEYEIVHSVTTQPICVVSHLNLLKESPKTRPIVTEVIPFRGPSSGSTRVAILGNNFVDSPTMRVRFDNLDVIPLFHGTKTLVCQTPKHAPGTVTVKVCNDTNSWSETAGTFTFDDINPKQDSEKVTTIGHEFNISNAISDTVFTDFGSDMMMTDTTFSGYDFGSDLVPLWQNSDFVEL